MEKRTQKGALLLSLLIGVANMWSDLTSTRGANGANTWCHVFSTWSVQVSERTKVSVSASAAWGLKASFVVINIERYSYNLPKVSPVSQPVTVQQSSGCHGSSSLGSGF